MKRLILIIIFVFLGCHLIDAQEINNISRKEVLLRNALWYNTNNPSGLMFAPIDKFNDLVFSYNNSKGDFRKPQSPSFSNNFNIKTHGITDLRGFRLLGDFSFTNSFDRGESYNTFRYRQEEDMPYTVMDTVASPWIRQSYKMSFKMASPILWDKISFGIGIDYHVELGAKNRDPRAIINKNGISVYPSVAYKEGDNIWGLNGFFNYNYERAGASLANYLNSYSVFLTKGLGEAIIGQISGLNSVGSYYYNTMKIGGALQYGFRNSNIEILSEHKFSVATKDVFQSPILPQKMGTAQKFVYNTINQILFGLDKSHKLALNNLYSQVGGIEYIIKRNQYLNNYKILASNKMSSFIYENVNLCYDYMIGRGQDFIWDFGLEANYYYRNYHYLLPKSSFNASSVNLGCNISRNILLFKSSILLKISLLYNKGIKGEYRTNSSHENKSYANLYRKNLVYDTDNYVLGSFDLGYTINSKRVNYFLNLNYKNYFTLGYNKNLQYVVLPRNRSFRILKFSFGILF